MVGGWRRRDDIIRRQQVIRVRICAIRRLRASLVKPRLVGLNRLAPRVHNLDVLHTSLVQWTVSLLGAMVHARLIVLKNGVLERVLVLNHFS